MSDTEEPNLSFDEEVKEPSPPQAEVKEPSPEVAGGSVGGADAESSALRSRQASTFQKDDDLENETFGGDEGDDGAPPSSHMLAGTGGGRSAAAIRAREETVAPADEMNEEWDEVDHVEVKKKLNDFVSFWPKARLEALEAHISTAPWHEHKYKSLTYEKILTGVEVCEWLLENNYCEDETEATSIGQNMIDRHMIYHMKQKREADGFKVDEKFWFSLVPVTNQEFGNRLSRLFQGKKVNYGAPVAYRKEGNLVTATIVERQRRGEEAKADEPAWPFTADGLKEEEPPTMSCPMAEVPMPSCDKATPDMCEWMTEWVVEEVDGKTGPGGWIYAMEFGIDHDGWTDKEERAHVVRKRHWIRTARKRPEREKGGAKRKKTDDVEVEEKMDDETMLSKMAAVTVRQPRAGFMEMSVIKGEGLWKMCDSFIVVECRDTKDKSAVCSRKKQHAWDHKSFITMRSDLDAITIRVFQNSGKKPCLGQAEFFIPEDEVGGDRTLKLKPDDDDKSAQQAGYSSSQLGALQIEWAFNVDGAGAAAMQLNGADGGLQRCVFSFHAVAAKGLTAGRKGLGPCGTFNGGPKASKVFLRLMYRGEFCEMLAESKPVNYKTDIDFDWKVSVDCSPSHTIWLELRGVGVPPIAKMHFDWNGDEAEVEMNLPFRGANETVQQVAMDVSDERMASAGGQFGSLDVKYQFEKLKSSFEELVDAKEQVIANEGGGRTNANMLKWW